MFYELLRVTERGDFSEIMTHAVVKITLKAAWEEAGLKSRYPPCAQGRILFSFYQVCTCLNPNTQSHSLVCVSTVSTGTGHEGTLCCVQAVGLLLCRRTQRRRR